MFVTTTITRWNFTGVYFVNDNKMEVGYTKVGKNLLSCLHNFYYYDDDDNSSKNENNYNYDYDY
jgi:hypothetical protein